MPTITTRCGTTRLFKWPLVGHRLKMITATNTSRWQVPATHSRFENRIDSKTIFKLHEVLVDTFLDSFDEPPEEIFLDYDATDDLIHGNQAGRYFNGFYDGYCFLPLYVFCGDQILVSYLRPAASARPITLGRLPNCSFRKFVPAGPM